MLTEDVAKAADADVDMERGKLEVEMDRVKDVKVVLPWVMVGKGETVVTVLSTPPHVGEIETGAEGLMVTEEEWLRWLRRLTFGQLRIRQGNVERRGRLYM